METRLVRLGIRRNGFDEERWLGPGSAHGRVTPTGRGVYRRLSSVTGYARLERGGYTEPR